jgi:predicted nucleotidyltransferase
MAKILAEEMASANTKMALLARRAERAELLKAITERLAGDGRVAAAWVHGSLGRDDCDDLSDIDLRVAIRDEHIGAVCRDRQAFAAQFGTRVLFLEAPQNRPPGGAFLLALYAAAHGPQEVDWSWQPASEARIWPDTQVLVDRAGLSRVGEMPAFEYLPVPDRTPLESASCALDFFWVMLLINAKYAARSPREERMGLLEYVVKPLNEVGEYLDTPVIFPLDQIPGHASPSEKISLLRELASRMESLMPLMETRGASVPGAIVTSVRDYLALIEEILLSA